MAQIKNAGRVAALTGAGLLAGFINGLLGAGGGIIVIRALGALTKDVFPDKRDVYVHALAVMLPLSVLSVLQYAVAGQLTGVEIGAYLLPALLGGIGGALLLGRLRVTFVNKLFSLLVIWSGIWMLIR